jgi:CHAD domain-containing protein
MAITANRGKSVFRKTEKELLRLSSGRSADAVHGFRTSTRRLQTLLEQIVTGNNRRHKKLLKMLDRIRKSAGKVRDIDAQLDALRSLKIPQEPRRKTQLIHSLLDVRAEHEKRLRKLLKKDNVREIRKRLKRAAGLVRFGEGRDPLVVAREMLASVPLPNGPADEKTLHRYRTVVKSARYAAEFAPKTAGSAHFLGQLKRLQDALGNWHDWLTLTHTATEHLGGVNESSLVAVLHNVTRGKLRHAVAAVAAAKNERPAGQHQPPELKTSQKRARKDRAVEARRIAAA